MRWSRKKAAALARPELLAEGFDPDAYAFEYRPRFPTDRLQPLDACRGDIPYEGPLQWVAWLDAEAAYWATEGHPKDYVAMADWWLKDPSRAPIIAVAQPDGTACVIDGAHRTAIAHARGRLQAPVILGIPRRVANAVETYWTRSPSEPVDVPWSDELLDDLGPTLRDPQMRLLLDPQMLELLDRLATAPRRTKYVERTQRSRIQPMEYPGAEEGWFLDQRTGRRVVLDEDGWFIETPHPAGAVTAGELVQLEHLLWDTAKHAAVLSSEGMLTEDQRQKAAALVDAAENLSLRLSVLQIQADPHAASQLKQEALGIMAREANRSFAQRPHKWNEVLIAVPGKTLTRGQIRDLYMQNAEKIVDAMRGYDALVLIGVGKNKTILRRHGPDKKPIRIDRVFGVDDPHALEYWANRRLVELHRVVGARTDVVWVDLDPKGDGGLRKVVLDVVPRIEAVIHRVYPRAKIVSWDSGKRGVHVEGYLPRPVSTDAARRKLRAELDREFAEDPRFTTKIAQPGQVRLDVTTLKRTGSVRTPWTPTVEGRIKRPL